MTSSINGVKVDRTEVTPLHDQVAARPAGQLQMEGLDPESAYRWPRTWRQSWVSTGTRSFVRCASSVRRDSWILNEGEGSRWPGPGTRVPGALGEWENYASISVMGSLQGPKWQPLGPRPEIAIRRRIWDLRPWEDGRPGWTMKEEP